MTIRRYRIPVFDIGLNEKLDDSTLALEDTTVLQCSTFHFYLNEIKDVTIVRMEVPCCGGLEIAVKNALQASGKFMPWQVVTVSRDGRILD